MRPILKLLLAFAGLAAVPALAEQPLFSIGAIADCQYADEPDAPPRLYHTAPGKLAAAVADFNRRKLAFAVHLGDFIDKDMKSYDALLPIAGKLRHPWRFVLGNHDFGVDDADKARVPARLGMPARYHRFVNHGWMFIVTDGNGLSAYAWPQGSAELAHSMAVHAVHYPDKPLWDGAIDEAQMDWIDARLSEADRRGLKVMLFSHFPLWPENPHNLWNAPDVIALLERHPSVKVWLDGHNHEGNYGLRDGIHYVNLKAMLDTEETAYAVLDFFADRVELHGIGRQQSMTLKLR
ncbi:metallophosphoesterase [Sphingomonas sp. MMS24-J13]|uniref:metallophosphoesterase n=1 Tax=Sphingomonas sp. MMS24-J13 TaxID=3238686 RepID=UPI00384CB125